MPSCKVACGGCCKVLEFLVPDIEICWEFYGKRGRNLKIERSTARPGFLVVEVNHRCPNLSKTDKCKIYVDRPMACRNYLCEKGIARETSAEVA